MTEQSSNIETRYELIELVEKEDLTKLIRSFCRALSVAGGVVKNPKPWEDIHKDVKEFKEWRLTPVVGFDRSGREINGGSEFCKAIRTLDYGDKLCMRGDLAYARTAFHKCEVQDYHCPSANLIDMVAPIRVGGHHLANVYFGQLRDEDVAFDIVWDKYQDLKRKSTNADRGIEQANELRKLYDELRIDKDTIGIAAIKDLLQHLADLISRKAARQAVVKVIDEICSEIVSSFDLKQGMGIILGKIGRVINFDSGSIMIAKGGSLVPIVSLHPDALKGKTFRLDSENGIAPLIFSDGDTHKYNTLEEMNGARPPVFKESRILRGLQSFLGTPLILNEKTVGIIELANREEHIYTEDDKRLIELLAKYVALHLKSNRENRILLALAREKSLENLFKIVVNTAPKLVNGRGCSIFLRKRFNIKLPDETDVSISLLESDLSSLPAVLVETTELRRDMIGKAFYEPEMEESLTGAILATGQCLNIPGGKGARTTKLSQIYPNVVWNGKYHRDDVENPKKYYADRPFLGVPIKGSEGVILGVIRIPDSEEGKREFSDNDLAILNACAAEVATALEANSSGHFFHKILGELNCLREQYTRIKDLGNVRQLINKITRYKPELPLSVVFLCCFAAILGCGVFAVAISFLIDVAWSIRMYLLMFTLVTALFTIYLWRRAK